MKSNFLTSWFYRRTFKKFLKQILSKVNEAEELWEIDEEMDMLWKLGDKGEISAFIAYTMVLLRDDKSWRLSESYFHTWLLSRLLLFSSARVPAILCRAPSGARTSEALQEWRQSDCFQLWLRGA